jgi:hypothetical protein
LKFNAVGAMGMVVQLGLVAVFNRLMAGRYLLATALAIEITLLHNFFWHVRYTWRDRKDSAGGAVGSVSFVERVGFDGGEPGADAFVGGVDGDAGVGCERRGDPLRLGG